MSHCSHCYMSCDDINMMENGLRAELAKAREQIKRQSEIIKSNPAMALTALGNGLSSLDEELRIMQLAAISTVLLQNTIESAKERIIKGNPYWTVAYQDACDAVDREIKLRSQLEKAEKALNEILTYQKHTRKERALVSEIARKYFEEKKDAGR